MPATPTIVSANSSNVKIDGEVVPGFQYIEYNLDGQRGTVSGTLKVRSVLPKIDSAIVSGQSKTRSFQVVVEIKKLGQQINTLSFDECYFERTKFSMDMNSAITSEYTFNGSKIRNSSSSSSSGSANTNNLQSPSSSTGTGLSAPRPKINIVKRDGQTQAFNRIKLERSIVSAGATPTQANLVSNNVVRRIGDRESIPSREVSSMTARSLSRFNTTASRNYATFRNQKYKR